MNTADTSELDRLSQVLKLVDLGLCVIPLAPRGKAPFTPLLRKSRTGGRSWVPFGNSPASRQEITTWVEKHPDLNFGVITGAAGGGLVVADCDHGLDTKHNPPTWIVETGRGRHRYYRADSPVETRSTEFGHLKGEGGYVVVPPSVHRNGKAYRWAESFSPWEVDLEPLPRELRAAGLKRRFQIVDQATDDARKFTLSGLDARLSEELGGLSTYAEMAKDAGVMQAVLRRLHIRLERLGAKLLCPLPGHDEKTGDPSAALWAAKSGYIYLQCFHDCECWSVPDLLAANVTGEYRHLRKGETAMWWLRGLDDAGVAPLDPIPRRLVVQDALNGTQDLLDGFVRLWRLRLRARPEQKGMPFTYEFAARWCGLDYAESSMARRMRWLIKQGYVVMVKGPGPRYPGDTKLTLYQPGWNVNE